MVWLVSCVSVREAHLLITRCVSTPEPCNICNNRTPKIVPVAPVMPTISLVGLLCSMLSLYSREQSFEMQTFGVRRLVAALGSRLVERKDTLDRSQSADESPHSKEKGRACDTHSAQSV